jgi:probable biosynthetic protein (TIGR04098 family)
VTESGWREFRLHVGMPHLQPGRLAEEPILKQLGAFQWQAVAAMAGQPENALVSEAGERLHISMISLELGLPAGRAWDEFDEGAWLCFRTRAGVYGHKLVEALFVFDQEPIPEEELVTIAGRDDLVSGRRPWAYLTHGFITRTPGTWAKLETPRAFLEKPVPELPAMPAGIAEHQAVERTGTIEGFTDWVEATTLALAGPPVDFDYRVAPETDLNAVGVVYCARLPAIMAGAERQLLRERLRVPLSAPLCACLAPQHRRIYYFANANREISLRLHVEARFSPAAAAAPAQMRTLGRLLFRTDVLRASDGVLMASSLCEKVLRVPGQNKPLLTEWARWLAHLPSRASPSSSSAVPSSNHEKG